MEEVVVSGVTHDKKQVKFSILGVKDKPGIAAKIFSELSKGGVNVDMIIQSAPRAKINDISFTANRVDFKKAYEILKKVNSKMGSDCVTYDDKVAKISIVGVGMMSHPGVAAKMFGTLSRAGINIDMISTSEIKVSCAINERHIEKAVKALHKAFLLNK